MRTDKKDLLQIYLVTQRQALENNSSSFKNVL